MPNRTIVFKVVEIGAKKPWSEASITISPIEDILFGVDMKEGEHYTLDENETPIFSIEGIRNAVKATTYALYFTDEKSEKKK
jgi:hypothetical protein